MAYEEHLAILKQGVKAWNQWREENPETRPYLVAANLRGAYLDGADLRNANLTGADLRDASLIGADLRGAKFEEAELDGADFRETDLRGADLSGAHFSTATANLEYVDVTEQDVSESSPVKANLTRGNPQGLNLRGKDLTGANLTGANLSRADLNGALLCRATLVEADLTEANLVNANLDGANLSGCRIYGVSAWGVSLEQAEQKNLVITPAGEPEITADNLEVAQFIYLLLHNEKIRDVIDAITTKVVLILGRFTPERKAVLDAIREQLRHRNYIPVLFDFDKPASRDTQETITTLARLARFVIADITDPKSIPQELIGIVQTMPSLPIQPILLAGCEPWGMFDHIANYPWVLTIHRYRDLDDLLASLADKVIAPAETKTAELVLRDAQSANQ